MTAPLAFQVAERYDRVRMLKLALVEVVERTGQHREGWYALRLINDLEWSAFRVDPAAGLEGLRQSLDNLCSTIQTHIDRLDA